MNILILSIALLAQPVPPEVEDAIRAYHLRQEHEAEQADHAARQEPAEAPPGAPAASPRLLAIIRPGGTVPLSQAFSGEKLVLLGENLPEDGRLMLARREAIITRRSPTFYELTAPSTAAALSGPVDLFIGTIHQARLAGVTFALRPEPTIRPFPGPMVSGYRDAAGTPLRGSVRGGTVVLIEGSGFGTVRGRVLVGSEPVEVLAWSPAQIRIRLPAGAGPGGRARTVTVWVGGKWYQGLGLEVVR